MYIHALMPMKYESDAEGVACCPACLCCSTRDRYQFCHRYEKTTPGNEHGRGSIRISCDDNDTLMTQGVQREIVSVVGAQILAEEPYLD